MMFSQVTTDSEPKTIIVAPVADLRALVEFLEGLKITRPLIVADPGAREAFVRVERMLNLIRDVVHAGDAGPLVVE